MGHNPLRPVWKSFLQFFPHNTYLKNGERVMKTSLTQMCCVAPCSPQQRTSPDGLSRWAKALVMGALLKGGWGGGPGSGLEQPPSSE